MSRHLRKVIAAILVPFAAAVVAGLVLLWPGGAPGHDRTGVGFDQQTRQGTVVRLTDLSCRAANALPEQPAAGGPVSDACQKATIEVASGPDKGTTFTEIVQPDQSRRYTAGQGVVLAYAPNAPAGQRYSVTDVDRGFPLALLAGVCIAPTLTAGNQIAGDVAPPGAETEAYTWPITALVIGLAAGNWSAGAIVEAADWQAAFLVSAGGAALSALLAAMRWRTLQRAPLRVAGSSA